MCGREEGRQRNVARCCGAKLSCQFGVNRGGHPLRSSSVLVAKYTLVAPLTFDRAWSASGGAAHWTQERLVMQKEVIVSCLQQNQLW